MTHEAPSPEAAAAPATTGHRIVVPDRLAHIVLRTAAKRPLMDWYRTVLGALIVFENDFIGFLTYDSEHHRVAVIEMPDLAASTVPSAGLHHVAFTYGSLRDLLDTYRRLKAAGIAPAHAINHGPTTSMYYRDPDGNSVELQIDNFASADEAAAWFQSGDFAINPIGVDFDPEDLVARFVAGVPEETLKQRPDIGPRGLPSR